MTQAMKDQMWTATTITRQSILLQWHTLAHVARGSSWQRKKQQPGIREEISLVPSIFSSHWFLGKWVSRESNPINVSNYGRWSHSFENSLKIDHIFPYLPNCSTSIVDSTDEFISSVSSETYWLPGERWRSLKSQPSPQLMSALAPACFQVPSINDVASSWSIKVTLQMCSALLAKWQH